MVTNPFEIYNTDPGQSTFEFGAKPAEIVVEEKDGEFKIYRITEKMVPKKVKEEMKFKLFDGNGFGEFLTWMVNLSNDELEAARQIYYDIWNFKSGSSDDKARFELLEGEQEKRKAGLTNTLTTTVSGCSSGGNITFTSGTGAGVAVGGAGGAGGFGGTTILTVK